MAEHRPPGRPPIKTGESSVSVHLRLPASQYDALDRRALLERASSVPELIRRRLAAGGEDDESED